MGTAAIKSAMEGRDEGMNPDSEESNPSRESISTELRMEDDAGLLDECWVSSRGQVGDELMATLSIITTTNFHHQTNNHLLQSPKTHNLQIQYSTAPNVNSLIM